MSQLRPEVDEAGSGKATRSGKLICFSLPCFEAQVVLPVEDDDAEVVLQAHRSLTKPYRSARLPLRLLTS